MTSFDPFDPPSTFDPAKGRFVTRREQRDDLVREFDRILHPRRPFFTHDNLPTRHRRRLPWWRFLGKLTRKY